MYSNQLNEIKFRLQRDIYGVGYKGVRHDSFPTITTNTSLSSMPYPHKPIINDSSSSITVTSPSNSGTANSSVRRDTINSGDITIGSPDIKGLICYFNQTTESTQL